MNKLVWPNEQTRSDFDEPHFFHAGSNICLDFHGDPLRAQLAVFSDGNHHMALQECLQLFAQLHPEVEDIFYTTTPPRVIVQMLQSGSLHVGNLRLTATPHLIISPPEVLDRLVKDGHMQTHQPFMQSRGNVLLVRYGNPKKIRGLGDLLRKDVRTFLSNPHTETVSYKVYETTLKNLARRENIVSLDFLNNPQQVVFGETIHHREAPHAVAEDRADAAVIYYHLALRYTRIFPDVFEIVPLTGNSVEPAPDSDNVTSQFHLGLAGNGGKWGNLLLEFLTGNVAAKIYQQHGLLPVQKQGN